jgi:serine/threonine protein kinase
MSIAPSVPSHSPSVSRHSYYQTNERLRPLKCVGNWQLTKLAGRGSFTEVFLARPLGCRPNWPADYAVKILNPQFARDELAIDVMRREVEVASQVSHQHLVAILEAHFDDIAKYLVMPRLKGVSVGQVIEKVGYVSIRQSLWIIRQVTEALDTLHRAGWLHGDVKPENIMLSPQGHVTLIDLGFALRKNEAMMTEVRTVRGTLNYVAPETMTSVYCSDERSDIYSLGITLFQMLTGRLPFDAQTPADLIEAHRGQPIPDPRQFNDQIPDTVVRMLSRMTAKQPVRRHQSVRELVTELLPLEVAAMKSERQAC